MGFFFIDQIHMTRSKRLHCFRKMFCFEEDVFLSGTLGGMYLIYLLRVLNIKLISNYGCH